MKTLKHFVAGFQITVAWEFKTYNEFTPLPKGSWFFPFCPLSRKEKEKKSLRPLRLERTK
jgi:hypothetical protein